MEDVAPDSIWELGYTVGVERVNFFNKIVSNFETTFKKGKKTLIYLCSPLLLDIVVGRGRWRWWLQTLPVRRDCTAGMEGVNLLS